MSSSFSCNQFESAFIPHRMQNYEVPRKFKAYPSSRTGCTAIVSNDRGHLNNNQLRSQKSPWGDFLGTWQRPRKPIQLQIKTKLMVHQERARSKSATSVRSQMHSGMSGQDKEATQEQEESSHALQSEQNASPHQGSSTSSPLPRTPTSLSQGSHEEQSRPSTPSPNAESNRPSSNHSVGADSYQTSTVASPSQTPSQSSVRRGLSRQSLDSHRSKSAPTSRTSSRVLSTQPTLSARVKSAATQSSRSVSHVGSGRSSGSRSATSHGTCTPSSSCSSRPPTHTSNAGSTKEAAVQCPSIKETAVQCPSIVTS